MAAARELWKALSLHCSGLHLVGIIEIGNVLHHIFTTDFADGCSVALGEALSRVSGSAGRSLAPPC